jgi:hypothetical protein
MAISWSSPPMIYIMLMYMMMHVFSHLVLTNLTILDPSPDEFGLETPSSRTRSAVVETLSTKC